MKSQPGLRGMEDGSFCFCKLFAIFLLISGNAYFVASEIALTSLVTEKGELSDLDREVVESIKKHEILSIR